MTQNFYQVLYLFLILIALVLCILFIYFLFEDLFFFFFLRFILLLFWTYSICMYSLLCLNPLPLVSCSPELKKHHPLLLNLIHGTDTKPKIWNDRTLNVRTEKESKRLHLRSKMQNNPDFHFYLVSPHSSHTAI